MGDNKNIASPNGEFYIGWMGNVPKTFAAFIKKYVLLMVPVVIAVGVLLAVSQKKFSAGNFEFGTLTEVKGVYADIPVPNIRVFAGRDIWGNGTYITIPLVGFGKFGADGIIAKIEQEKGASLNGKQLQIKGTLLYNDGKIIMQVDGNDNPVTKILDNNTPLIHVTPKEIGNVTVRGEIIDPKCYFGVMKPGEGKPHKDCAIRCIIGGISPMVHATNEKGESNYYLIVGSHGEKMNQAVQGYVATPVEITGKAIEINDWIVLYVAGKENIRPISKSAFFQPRESMMACAVK